MARAGDECDVLVVGGGPAGSTAAQLLAAWGWSVLLVHHPSSRPALAESLPSSTRKLLTFLGQLERVEASGFYPNQGNVARWANASRTTRTSDAGFHVSRDTFDSLLRDCARSAGARIVDAAVRRVEIGDRVEVTCAGADGRVMTCRARYVLDCSGRAGVVARHGFRRADAGYRTLAIAAEWDCADWPAEEHAQTVIESYSDGWAWSVPLSRTRRQCTVMIDPGRGFNRRRTGSPGPHLQTMYEREREKLSALGARLAGATQTSEPWACDASIYDATRAADRGVLLVGDAASFIEPLSSAGVKKALLSAWRAAVVTNTCLGNGSLAGAAIDLYVRREREVYSECVRRSTAFFAEAATAYATPFWSARAAYAGAVAARTASAADDLTDDALARDVEVHLAFDRLRTTEHVRLRQAPALRFEPVAAIEGREVVMRDALVVPGLETPLHFAAGVDLPALARLATSGGDVPAIIAAYHAQIGPVPLRGLLTGLSLLVARHALVAEDTAS